MLFTVITPFLVGIGRSLVIPEIYPLRCRVFAEGDYFTFFLVFAAGASAFFAAFADGLNLPGAQ